MKPLRARGGSSLVVADNADDGGDFPADSDALAALLRLP